MRQRLVYWEWREEDTERKKGRRGKKRGKEKAWTLSFQARVKLREQSRMPPLLHPVGPINQHTNHAHCFFWHAASLFL